MRLVLVNSITRKRNVTMDALGNNPLFRWDASLRARFKCNRQVGGEPAY
jgi:hypothetical protein